MPDSALINTARGPAFSVDSSSNALLDDITSSKPLIDAPVLRITKSTGSIVRSSRAFPGTQTFLSTAPGELKSIRLQNNLLEDAKTATAEN